MIRLLQCSGNGEDCLGEREGEKRGEGRWDEERRKVVFLHKENWGECCCFCLPGSILPSFDNSFLIDLGKPSMDTG